MNRKSSSPHETGTWTTAELSASEFGRLSAFIEGHCGIKMPDGKKVMLESRLRKRLRTLGLKNFSAYCDFVLAPGAGAEAEVVQMIDAVTTNKTDFFREPQHFEYLVKTALPALMQAEGAGIRRDLMVWSAGCSSGEEPYTLSMVLAEVSRRLSGFRFLILATDICSDVLAKARAAIYEEPKIEPVPHDMRKKYLLRSKNAANALVRVVPELRSLVRFRRLNFLDEDFGLREQMDVIFCRNVFIYFDRETQEAILKRFCRHLIPGGYVFLGHSETINGLRVPLTQVAPTVYRTAK
ncbi:MAG: protein-glutamate O-methyltransferase [Deltaproteobacteria bacterium]|nr:protein-glutamate O-methyltransferase [Deltaproteobacteria bacterium]